jgi:hypothetical protein
MDPGGQGGAEDCLEGEPRWACDPSYWTPVSVEPNICKFYKIDLEKAKFPPLLWSSCGPGCGVTSVQFSPEHSLAAVHSSGAFFQGGEVYLKLDIAWPDPKPGRMSAFVRASDGIVVNAFQQTSSPGVSCGTLQYGRNAPSHLIYSSYLSKEDEKSSGYVSGRFESSNGFSWNPFLARNLGIPTSAFEYEKGWGILAGGKIGLIHSPAQKEFEVVGYSPGYSTSGYGPVIVWPGSYSSDMWQSLQRYHEKQGVTTILEKAAAPTINRVALSENHLAWISTDGIDGKYKNAFLSWSPSPKNPTLISQESIQTISLPVDTGLLQLQIFNDFAVTSGHISPALGSYRLFVVHMPSKKIWMIPTHPEYRFSWMLGISPDEIFISAKSDLIWHPTAFDKIVRLRLDHLDELEAAWTPAP